MRIRLLMLLVPTALLLMGAVANPPPKASATQFGLVEVDNVTITATGGVISAVGGGGGGGSLLVTDGTHSVPATTTLTVGGGFVIGGSAGSATLNGTVPDGTHTSGYTLAAGDMTGQVNFNGSSLTATIPSISSTVFAAGMNALITNTNASALTISSTPTINGCASQSTIYQGGFMALVSNGTTLDCAGFPGFGAVSGDVTMTSAGVATVGKIGGVAITLGTLTNGDACTYTSSGTVINCNTSIGGGGNVSTSGTINTDGFPYWNGSTTMASTAAATNGQLLIGSTSAAPVLATLTAGTGITITNAAGSITIASTGGASGAWVEIANRTASNSTALVFGQGQTEGSLVTLGATYHVFKLVCSNLTFGVTGSVAYLQVGEGATPTFETTGYNWSFSYQGPANYSGDSGNIGSSGSTNVGISPMHLLTGAGSPSNARMEVTFSNPEATTVDKTFDFVSFHNYDGTTEFPLVNRGGGLYLGDHNAITALQLVIYSTTNGTQETGANAIVSGQCSLYGLTP